MCCAISASRPSASSRSPWWEFAGTKRTDLAIYSAYVAVAFESEEAYRNNAATPEQDAWYRRMLEHLEGDPEWHDGEIVQSF